jgi:3-deoxy-7-phosphoheptulonate synthase
MTIDELRRRIDLLDEKLVELLNERAQCALEIGKLKQALRLDVYQPDREAARRRCHRAGVRTDHRRGAAHRARHGSFNGGVRRISWKSGGSITMVVVMEERASEAQIEKVVASLVDAGMDVHRSTGVNRTVLGVVGAHKMDSALIEVMDGVHEVLRITEPYKLASRAFKPEGTVITIDDVRIGGDEVIVMAGPCSAENEEQVFAAAAAVKKAGAKIFRGGAFKPRSSPYSFQGLGEEGLRMLREAADQHNMKLVSEVMDVSQIDLVGRYSDIYQVGARNMQNYTLLRELGRTRKPVLLKRGIAATIEEWLLSAEYILAGGNTDVILCERGIRTFESYTRNTLDISAIPVIKKLSHLPIITDPSHATGRRDKVAPMARASVAAGADGLIIEVHCNPDKALSDGAQSMYPAQFDRLMAELRIIAPAIGRSICVEPVVKRGWGR